MGERQILALGGGGETEEQNDRIARYVVGVSGKERPRVLYVPTASADADASIVRFYSRYAGFTEPSHLTFFPWPPTDLRRLALDHGVGSLAGGIPAYVLAIWRAHGCSRVRR